MTKSSNFRTGNYFAKVLFLSAFFIAITQTGKSQCLALFKDGTNGFNYTHEFKNMSIGSMYKTYKWDFGDGTASTLTNPIHTYTTPDPMSVCLYVTDTSTNCSDTLCQLVYNCDSRFAYMVKDNFVEILADAPGIQIGDRYDFGDGFSYSGSAPFTHMYDKRYTYNLCHTKYCTSTEKTVTCNLIDLSCKADFTYKSEPKDSLKFLFTNQSKGNAATYIWTFGERYNQFNTDANPTYKYMKSGYYNVGLRLKDSTYTGCSDSVFKTIVIGDPSCDTSVYVSSAYEKKIIFGSVYHHKDLRFDFGNGIVYFAQKGEHNVRKSGTYTIKISFICYTGDTVRMVRNVFVPPSDSCHYLKLDLDITHFNCSDTIGLGWADARGGQPPYTYVWNTQPPTKGRLANISKAGVYEVKVTDDNKCSVTKKMLFNGFNVNKVTDVRTHLIASTLQPGRHGSITVEATNDGCVKANGQLFLVLDPLLDYQWATPLFVKRVRDTLFWNYSDLEKIQAVVYFKTKTSATVKDTVYVSISASKDAYETNTANNTKTYRLFVVNSHDPNMKHVYPYGECTNRYVDKNKPLTYTLQFQNTGNAPAIDIAIVDQIPGKMFDINTLRIVGQSHPDLVVEIMDSNRVKFRHDNIYLPDSVHNEEGSHGFIMYEISPVKTLPNYTKVGGKADIYFDFNSAVITNSTNNTLIDKVPVCVTKTSIEKALETNGLHLYPNPGHGLFYLEIDKPSNESCAIEIINCMGVSVYQQNSQESKLALNLGFLPDGIYWILVKTEGKVITGKFVKQ